MRRDIRLSIQATVIVVLAAFVSGCSYNRFTTQEEAIKAQWGEVQNQLQRRNDLIPNLVETVKGYAAHEEGVYKDIADSRSRQLRANEQFNRLMDELAGTENRIAVARGRYNTAIQEYNTQRRRFPANVTAKVFGFKEYPYFEAPTSAQTAPKVDFKR